MTIPILIAIAVGVTIGLALAVWYIVKQHTKDEYILSLLQRGLITVNEAREWRETGQPSSRLTDGKEK